ncbi:MAG: TonB-dependent receptor [Saprospiraceae bacterium]|nr:TonB-dependent receptor [Saprospiraceae bacterium]MCZ2340032.1 TonB-dependent receptor [Chitinophagales bacterium]
MKYLLTSILILNFFISGFAQGTALESEPNFITGIVMDENTKEPLEFTPVSVYSSEDSTLITGGITDENGIFSIEVKPGKFYLLIEFISYHPKYVSNIEVLQSVQLLNLGNILMSSNATTLQSVVITGEKSETTFSLDKRVFNVGKDLSNRGGTAQDILDNVPSVTVDLEGNVSLRGSENVKILIDGKPSGLLNSSSGNGLKAISASMIDRVEVITNPSARYEAEGMSGIINIVLKKDKKAGINGSFEVSGGYPENYGVGANVNYRKGRSNFFVNYGLNYNANPTTGYIYQEIFGKDEIPATYTVRNSRRNSLSNSFRGGMDFSISETQTITGSVLYKYATNNNNLPIRYYDYVFSKDEPRGRFEIPTHSYTERVENESETSPTLEYNIDYTKRFNTEGHELKAAFKYSKDGELDQSSYNEGFINNGINEGVSLIQRAENDEDYHDIIGTIDYIHPFGKDKKFEAGFRSQIRNISNDYLVENFVNGQWDKLEDYSNQFRYNEDVYAMYAIYGAKWKKLSYQGGLRAEYTDVKTELVETQEKNPRSYFDLFPSGHLNYELPGQNQIQISYSRRIWRPRFWFLNPFFTFSDNRNISRGNPNLRPELTDSYEAGHIKYWTNGNIGTNIYWRHSTDVMRFVTILNPDGTSISQPLNLAVSDNTGLEFLFMYNPVKWFKLDGSVNLFKNIIEGKYEGLDLGVNTFSWFGKLGTRFTFWQNAEFQARFNYRAPVDVPLGRRKGMYIVDFAMSKDFLNNNATITLAARDVFNSRRHNMELFSDEYYRISDTQWRRSPIVLTFNYRLHNAKERKRQDSWDGGGGDFEQGGQM